jgi:hypothetical protein
MNPTWLPDAIKVARRIRSRTRNLPGAKHQVYVVLIYDPDKKIDGVYVGLTGRTPEERFAQHRAGYKASGKVRRYGIELLPQLYSHLNYCLYEEGKKLEASLYADLKKVVPWAEGGH